MSSSAAVSVAKRTFPGIIDRTAGGMPELPAGERVVRFLGNHAAQIALPGGGRAVLQSAAPIATGAHGPKTPVNLSLSDTGSSFTPANPAVPVTISKELSQGVLLADSGVTLTPVDAADVALQASGSLDGQAVVYPNALPDSDAVAKPTADGFETYMVLRSTDSPENLYYRVGLPANGRLIGSAGHSGAEVEVNGHAIASILLPNATDAAGARVPVSMRVSGDVLALHVPHKMASYDYPIAVDPTIVDKQTAYSSVKGEYSNWAYASNNINAFNSVQENETSTTHGFYGIEDVMNEPFTSGTYGVISYTTQGESKITEFKVESYTPTEHAFVTTYMRIANKAKTVENQLELPASAERAWHSITAAGSNENAAIFEAQAKASGNTVQSIMYNTEVKLSQEKAPTISFETAKETIGSSRNALYPGNWGGPNSVFQVTGKDPGLGVWEISFKSPNALEWGAGHKANENIFTNKEECRGLECEQTRSPSLSTQGLPDGEDTIEAKVGDAAGLTGTASITKVKVDWTAPHNLVIGGIPTSHEVGDGSPQLKITGNATDGSGTTISSGVASIVLSIDGKQIGSPSTGCTPGPCSAHGEWSIGTENYAAGQHTVAIVATDNAGNVAKEETTFTVHHATPVSTGPGSVNPLSGEFSTQATDVAVPGGGTTLTVSRSYGSDHLSAGSEGPLGNAWSLSLGGQQSLAKTASGSMVLTATNGQQSVFASDGKGGFTAPAGSANLSLKEVTIKGAKDFQLSANGATTTFAIPSGGSGSVWLPSISEGAGGTNVTTFSYQTASGVTEPTEELAPVPSGVSCSPTLNRGCRALTFNYASSTTATSEAPSGWGDYIGHLTRVYLTAWEPSLAKMTTTTVAQYSYDNKGKLRAEWDPRISPALKTLYGYDAEGHLTAVAPAGLEPWLLAYGIKSGDVNTGRLVSVTRPSASTALGEGAAPSNTAAPSLSPTSPTLGKPVTISNGTWSNSPLAYSYQWERCASGGSNCTPIYGARNQSYVPTVADGGYTLVAQVAAANAGGSVVASTSASEVVAVSAPTATLQFGSLGTSNGQFKTPTSAAFDASGNMWITDQGNNRVEEFSPSGQFVSTFGTAGTENGQFKGPWGIAVEQSTGNLFVSDSSNCRVQEFSSAGAFIRAFGSCGSGNGQLGAPCGVALDPEGNVWVADFTDNRLSEFSNAGVFLRTVGSAGTGNGQLKSPRNIAFVGSNMYVTDMGNNRVEEFSAQGTYLAQFGSEGTANGQFKAPMGIAADPLSGDLYVADDNNNRVQQFTGTGAFVTTFGTAGTEPSQLKNPIGLAVNSNGTVIVMDMGNNRASQWSPTPTVVSRSQFGSLGSGNGQLKKPIDDAVDPHGNIWVTDSSNNRIEEFSPTGAYLAAYGTLGSGACQFNSPAGIAINQNTGTIYVADQKNNRVDMLGLKGECLGSFGGFGTAGGKFSNPVGIAIDSSGNVWVVDFYNSRVEEFSSEGVYKELTFGTHGSENGQFVEPAYVAISGGNLYVTDSGNSRVEEFDTAGKYLNKFGAFGAGNGQFNFPEGIEADPATGELYVVDVDNHRVQVFSRGGTFVGTFGTSGTEEGHFGTPVGIAFNETGSAYITDYGNNRVAKWTTGYRGLEPVSLLETGSSAVWTIAYKVPISGVGAPYMMSSSEVSKWAQTDAPTEATAFFPPDEPQGTPALDYRRATVDYFDSNNRLVNEAMPSGGIATSEYNSNNDVVRTLSPDNREVALKEGAKSAEASQKLDTQSTFEAEGTELTSTLGPTHTVKLPNGTQVQARKHVRYYYDEGAPEGGPYRLVTKVTEGAQIVEKPEEDIRTTVTSYSGQENLGWTLRKPTSITNDSTGLKLVHTIRYDRATGNVIETRTPAAGSATESAPMSYTYSTSFGTLGSGNGQVSKPAAIARDSAGNIWVADTENNRVEEFNSSGVYVNKWGTSGVEAGQFKKPEGIAIDGSGNVWVADTGNNRLEEFTSAGGLLRVISSIEFLSLSSPTAIAFVSSGEEAGDMYLLETGGSRVREISVEFETAWMIRSFGGLGTGNGQLKSPKGMKMDSSGNLWVADTGNNRVEEFSSTGSYIQKFGTLGSGNGEFSKPEGLAIDSEGNVLIADNGNNRVQIFSPRGNYLYKFGTAGTGSGQMKTPTGVAVDSSNNAFVLDAGNNRIEKWTWKEQAVNGGTHATQTIYYSAGANSKYASCGEHAEWANIVCQTQPAEQPNTSGVPNLPVTKTTYNLLDEPLTKTETVGTTTRTATLTYDEVGRVRTAEKTSTVGTALPKVTTEYNGETGALEKQSITVEGKTKTITSVYNKLGELTSYTDADENTSTYSYDIDQRAEAINDGKGTQTFSYDAISGAPTKLTDSAAGIFTGAYDVEGSLTAAGYPNGMVANYARNAAGEPTSVEYVKTTYCSSGCTWFSDSIVPSIHGQWMSQASSLSTQAYTYDGAGRLTQVQDTPAGKGCITRIYGYDADTNRTSVTAREPGLEGKCATEGGASETHSYDQADRLNDTGMTYNTFGDITTLPAADAGGSELTNSFYVNNQLASQSQKGETIGYNLDPAGRVRETVSTGGIVSTVTSHYTAFGNAPSWSGEVSGKWERNIFGITGGMVAVQHNGETPVLQLANLHGDIVATAYLSETATELASNSDTTEFGVPRTSAPPKYSWYGAHDIPTELPSGVMTFGVRSYVPQLGRFLQPDPVPGGAANAYTYTNGDPVNEADLTGMYTTAAETPIWVIEMAGAHATEIAAEEAAREAAARREAELKAEEAARAAGVESEAMGEWSEEEWEEEEGEEEGMEYASAESTQGEGPVDAIQFSSLEEGLLGLANGSEEAPRLQDVRRIGCVFRASCNVAGRLRVRTSRPRYRGPITCTRTNSPVRWGGRAYPVGTNPDSPWKEPLQEQEEWYAERSLDQTEGE